MPVLVATNGSSHTESALRFGAQIAERCREPLTILTVIKHDAAQPQVAVDTLLAQAREMVEPQGIEVRTKVRIGHPALEIIREAEEGNYDLLIVGERQHRTLMAHFRQGSTAVRVAERAPCPVIVARGRIGPIQRILLCDSGSEDPSIGLDASRETHGVSPSVFRRFREIQVDLLDGSGEIVIVHVMSQMSAGPGVKGKHLRSSTEVLIEERAPEGELLQRDIEIVERLGIQARAKVRHGLVVEEILEEVHSECYDLVVIGAYRGQGWQRILLDDLARRIVAEVDRPVLVLR